MGNNIKIPKFKIESITNIYIFNVKDQKYEYIKLTTQNPKQVQDKSFTQQQTK